MDSIGTNTMTASYSGQTARAWQGGEAMEAPVEVYTESADDRDDLFRRIEKLERQVAEMQKAAGADAVTPIPEDKKKLAENMILTMNVSIMKSDSYKIGDRMLEQCFCFPNGGQASTSSFHSGKTCFSNRISTINYFVPHPMKPEEIFDSLASSVPVYASRFRRTTQVAVFGSKGTPICAETLDPTPFETTEIKSFGDLEKVFSRFLDLNKISYEDWERSR